MTHGDWWWQFPSPEVIHAAGDPTGRTTLHRMRLKQGRVEEVLKQGVELLERAPFPPAHARSRHMVPSARGHHGSTMEPSWNHHGMGSDLLTHSKYVA